MISFGTFVFAIVSAGLIYFFLKRNGKKYPPGPRGIPLLGNLLQMGSLPHLKVAEWAKLYGKIFTIHFGPTRLHVISDMKLIREAFNNPNMSGRMDLESFTMLTDGKHGIVNSEGEGWAQQRRFSLRALRDLGFGKKSMEVLIQDEVNDFLSFLKSKQGQPIETHHRFTICVLNVIWGILSVGNRLEQDDTTFLALFDRMKVLNEQMSKSMTFFVPSLAKLFPNLTGWNKAKALVADLRALFKSHVDQHKKTFNENSNPRDFIDVYLKEIKETTDKDSTFYKEAGEHSLVAVMADFFVAGPDTTSATLQWTILYLCKFPKVQEKVQAELDRVVGQNRVPTLADRQELTYTLAVIEEILRLSSIVPLGVFHRALADMKFNGYDISQGDWLCGNGYYLHTSSNIWKNPLNFEPERHLINDGKTIKRHEAFMAFGVGKRACVGEAVARDTAFLFLTGIFQKFQVSLAPQSKNVSLDPVPSFVLPPQDFHVVVTERF